MIFEKIFEMDNLRSAWAKVRAGKAPPGIDRMTCAKFEKNLETNLFTLKQQIKEERYRPLPVVEFNRRKKKGFRAIGISTVRDRVVQRAVIQVMGPHFDPNFLPCCYAYRRGQSALGAVAQSVKLIRQGYHWVLQMDVENFFDSMDHMILLDLIGQTIDEKPLKRLISRLLKARIFKEMGFFDIIKGAHQGSGLSPLLSNIYMLPLDRFLWKHYGKAYLRFSDDISVFSYEREPLEIARKVIERCLKEIKLKVNESKTSISHVSSGLVYMGYYIDINGKGPSRKSVTYIQQKLNTYNKVRKTDNIDEKLREITGVIRGWRNYYKTLKPVIPPNILSLIAQAGLAAELGETALARELLKQSRRFEHNHPDISIKLADLFLSMGMENQAMREYARALKMDPSSEGVKEKVRLIQESEEDIHKAIEKVRLMLHQNPSYQEGYKKLTELYTRLGLYGFAEKAHEKVLEIDEDGAMPLPESPPHFKKDDNEFDYRSVDQKLFLDLFSGRKNAHARQWVDEQGRWGFMRVDRPIKKQDIHKHLKGEITIGIYPASEDDTVRFIVFDVDMAKRIILESDANALDSFRRKTHADALRLKRVCEQMSLKLYIEDSGYKGRHGWLFFDKPVPASVALALGRRIIEKAGGPSENIVWELFPMGKSDRHKSIIKLPLGINQKSRRRCLFLNDDNKPIRDQSLLLRTIVFNCADSAAALFADQNKKSGGSDLFARLSGGLKKMVENCIVIRHLVCKARDTHYLNHYERVCLLYTLSFAGKDGVDFLHRVIGYCINYNQAYTQGQIDRRKDSPMSCPKIAEYFPELAEKPECSCKFKLPARGYPTPVMYWLESEIQQAGQYPFDKTDKKGSKQPCESGGESVEQRKKEKPESKHQGSEPLILDFEKLLAEEFGKLPPVTPIDGKKTGPPENPEKKDNDISPDNFRPQPEPSPKTKPVPETEPSPKTKNLPASPDPEDEYNGTRPPPDITDLMINAAKLIRQHQMVKQQMEECIKNLDKCFETHGSDAIETPFGNLTRKKQADGSLKWHFETFSLKV